MPRIVAILTLMSWISFMLSWVEYEKSCITRNLAPYGCLQMRRLTNISCAGPNYESFRTVSYQPRTPLGQSVNEYTAHLGKLNWSADPEGE